MYLENLKKQNDLTIMKDHDLLTRFSWVVQKEREAITTVVSYLSEIEKRKLYLKEAYSSLFSFVTQKFHYSEGAAYRRIQASKVSQIYPEVLELLSKGKVSLMTLSLIEPHLMKENGKELIEKIIGKSKREVEFILSGLSLKKVSYRDVIRRLPVKVSGSFPQPVESKTAQNFTFTGESASSSSGSETNTKEDVGHLVSPVRKIKVEFVAEEGLAGKIERAKEILRHKFPEGKFEDIFNQALEDLLEKRDPMRKAERAKKKEEAKAPSEIKIKENTPEKSEKFLSRYISQETKRRVWERDGGRCSYESADGRRCGERNFIQIDHVQPFALWGKSTEENLRLLCAQHNKGRAEKTFF